MDNSELTKRLVIQKTVKFVTNKDATFQKQMVCSFLSYEGKIEINGVLVFSTGIEKMSIESPIFGHFLSNIFLLIKEHSFELTETEFIATSTNFLYDLFSAHNSMNQSDRNDDYLYGRSYGIVEGAMKICECLGLEINEDKILQLLK